jgi:AraC-like DNA-binding protein
LAPEVVSMFEWVDIAVSISRPEGWFVIRGQPDALNLLDFELEHGVESERYAYNHRSVALVRRRKTSVIGEHRGFRDLFSPVLAGSSLQAVLVTGPFASSRPKSTDLLERWRELTGRQGHPADPEFGYYLASTLGTPVLDGPRLSAFEKLVACLGRMMTHQGSADAILAEVQALRRELAGVRQTERVWQAAEAMVRETTSRIWASPHRASMLEELGCARFPEHVVVGLCADRGEGSDPVDEFLRRDGFQRACVDHVANHGDVLSGRVGAHGVVLLCAGRGGKERTRRYLLELCDELSNLARRRFGLELHLGLSALPQRLSMQYEAALAAAELALGGGERIVYASNAAPPANPLGGLRRELGEFVEEKPAALPARFDRYLDAVAVRSGYRLDLARAHAEAGFERIAEALRDNDALDAKGFGALLTNLEHAASEASTLRDLFAAYRSAVADVVASVLEPSVARRDRSLRRAVEYMQKHYAEALSLERVARVAGFSPKYLSRAFHEKQELTFERYLTQLRIERARQLLSGSALNLQRVAQLCGFSSGSYLGRVFRKGTGETPLAYRKRERRLLAPEPWPAAADRRAERRHSRKSTAKK